MTRQLTQNDKTFLSNYTRWTCGPTFDIYFYCKHDYTIEAFEQALLSDPIVQDYQGPEHPQKQKWLENCVLLSPAEWPATLGARYVKCTYDDSKQNQFLLVFYPYHVQRLCGGELWDDKTINPALTALFIKHIVLLTARISQQIQVQRVIMSLDGDSVPLSQKTGIMLYTWFTRIGQWPPTQPIDDIYSLLSIHDILENPPQYPPVCITSLFRKLQQQDEDIPEPWDGRIIGYIFPKVQVVWDALGDKRQLEHLTHVWCPTCLKYSTISSFSALGDSERGLILDGGCVYCNSKLVAFIEIGKYQISHEPLQEKKLSTKSKVYAVDTRNFAKDTETVFAEYMEKLKMEKRKMMEELKKNQGIAE